MCYDLERLIRNFHNELTIDDIKIILFEIFKGVNYLHENKMIHRVFYFFYFINIFLKDLKSSNMLLNGNGAIKISDFSLIREIPEIPSNMTKNVVTR